MTARTLRNFDSDLRCECAGSEGVNGTECRLLTVGGETDGEMTVADEVGDIGGDMWTCAHAASVSGKKPPVLVQEPLPSLLLSRSGVDVRGLGLAEGVLAMTESGGRIEKILSSSGGGPYVSKGSGTACSIGSIIGSDL